jgi:transcriptional regulator with XRE-family HTH domain
MTAKNRTQPASEEPASEVTEHLLRAAEALQSAYRSDDDFEAERRLNEYRIETRAAERAAILLAQDRRRASSAALAQTPIDLPALVAKRLAYWRRLSGWSQARLSDAMNELGYTWSRVTVAEIENASRKVSLDELASLAALYGVPMLRFLTFGPNESYRLPDGRVLDAPDANQVIAGRNWEAAFDQESFAAARAANGSPDEHDWRPSRDVALRLFVSPGWKDRLNNLTAETRMKPDPPKWLALVDPKE